MQPYRTRLDLRVSAMKGFYVFPYGLVLLQPYYQIFNVISRTYVVGDTVGVFYSPKRHGYP